MKDFGFKISTQLKVSYINALMASGQAAAIKTIRDKAAAKEVSKDVAAGKRGSLIIPKGSIPELGFQEGDSFLVKRTKVGISLSRKYGK